MYRACVVACVLLLASCSSTQFLIANAPTTFDRVTVHRDLPYELGLRHGLDVYAPREATNRPVVVFWYGGSWVSGSKNNYRFVGTTLAEHGIVAVLPDYRLYPQATFPAFDEDGARAVAWVEQHIQALGGNPHRLVLMGHSAGGHTAAFLAFNHEFLRKYGADPKDVVGLVGLSGPYVLEPETDTERATFPPPYTEADWQPIRFVDSHAPPTLLLHGKRDREVWPREAIELRDVMVREHLRVELHLYERRGHADTVAPFAPVARWRAPAVDDVIAFVHAVAERD